METATSVTGFMPDERKGYVGRVVSEVGKKLQRFIRQRVRSESDAEDVLQDVWGQLLDSAADGPIEHAASWLYTVARNRITDHYRKRTAGSLDAMAEQMQVNVDQLELLAVMPAEMEMDDEERETWWKEFRDALAELPVEQRQVFLWHEIDGMTFQQIAETTGENINTLLSRKRYAVLSLRKRMEPLREDFYS